MVDVNRRAKINRFVAYLDARISESGANPESPDVAARAAQDLLSAPLERWTAIVGHMFDEALKAARKVQPFRYPKRETMTAEKTETRLGIVNVYLVRAGLPLLETAWTLPLPLCARGCGRPRFQKKWGDGNVTVPDVCQECDEADDKEVIDAIAHSLSAKGRAEAMAEERHDEQRRRFAR